ncbi:Phytochrome-like protein cph1 [compost metagenome]
MIFNRLHGRNEYSGTGIGLAICKRIADNHKGFIKAKGVLDTGATFTVFLPENPLIQEQDIQLI